MNIRTNELSLEEIGARTANMIETIALIAGKKCSKVDAYYGDSTFYIEDYRVTICIEESPWRE